MKTHIGIRWYPRKVETFQQTQHSIDFKNVTVYPDGHEFTHRTDFDVKYLGDHAGCFKHYYRTLEDLCKTDADVIGCFSDDMLYFKDWLSIAHQQFKRDPYTGYLACFTPRGVAKRFGFTHRKGWHQINGGWASSWGGGYLFKRKTAIKILKHPFIQQHLKNYEANQQIDHAIPEAVHQMGLHQYLHNPSLMQHIGKFSTIGHQHRKIDDAIGWQR
jgi:hypothetical protein